MFHVNTAKQSPRFELQTAFLSSPTGIGDPQYTVEIVDSRVRGNDIGGVS